VRPNAYCVTDTNVWIDLRVGNLLNNVFELATDWVISDFIEDEIPQERRELLVEWGLEELSLGGDDVEAVISLNEDYPAPSRTDMSALFVAQTMDGVLVTGDGALRSAAKQEGVEVHGTLWVADLLVDTGTVKSTEAARGLQLMMQSDRWLPTDEVNKRINAWQP
jgi:predicted nucleic acid-binding protein